MRNIAAHIVHMYMSSVSFEDSLHVIYSLCMTSLMTFPVTFDPSHDPVNDVGRNIRQPLRLEGAGFFQSFVFLEALLSAEL